MSAETINDDQYLPDCDITSFGAVCDDIHLADSDAIYENMLPNDISPDDCNTEEQEPMDVDPYDLSKVIEIIPHTGPCPISWDSDSDNDSQNDMDNVHHDNLVTNAANDVNIEIDVGNHSQNDTLPSIVVNSGAVDINSNKDIRGSEKNHTNNASDSDSNSSELDLQPHAELNPIAPEAIPSSVSDISTNNKAKQRDTSPLKVVGNNVDNHTKIKPLQVVDIKRPENDTVVIHFLSEKPTRGQVDDTNTHKTQALSEVLKAVPDPTSSELESIYIEPVTSHVDNIDNHVNNNRLTSCRATETEQAGQQIIGQIKVEPDLPCSESTEHVDLNASPEPSNGYSVTEKIHTVTSLVNDSDNGRDNSPSTNANIFGCDYIHITRKDIQDLNNQEHGRTFTNTSTSDTDKGGGLTGYIKVKVEPDTLSSDDAEHLDRHETAGLRRTSVNWDGNSVKSEPSDDCESVESVDSLSHLSACRKNLNDILAGLSTQNCKVYKCALCEGTVDGDSPSHLAVHILEHFPAVRHEDRIVAKWKCPFCTEYIRRHDSVVKHMAHYHANLLKEHFFLTANNNRTNRILNPASVPSCKEVKWVTASERTTQYLCTLCKRAFHRQTGLEAHIIQEHLPKPNPLTFNGLTYTHKCPICNIYVISIMNHLSEHTRKCKTVCWACTFQCTLCKETCLTKKALTVHVMQRHLQESVLTCCFCYVKLPPKQWTEHVYEKHSASVCTLCDEGISGLYVRNHEYLSLHIRGHLPCLTDSQWPDSVQCPLCVFSGDKTSLLVHINKEHLRNHKNTSASQASCPICNENVSTIRSQSKLLSRTACMPRNRLAWHIIKQHAITEVHQPLINQHVANICLMCGEMFLCDTNGHTGSFREHITKHARSCYTEWKCPLCEYACEDRATLYKHLIGEPISKPVGEKPNLLHHNRKVGWETIGKRETNQISVLRNAPTSHNHNPNSAKENKARNSVCSRNHKHTDFLTEGKDVIHVPDIKIKTEPSEPTEPSTQGQTVEIKTDKDGNEFFEVHFSAENELNANGGDASACMDYIRTVPCDKSCVSVSMGQGPCQVCREKTNHKQIKNCQEKDDIENQAPDPTNLELSAPWQCEHCPTKLASKQALRKHIFSKHIILQSAVCVICQAQVGDNMSLVQHMGEHLSIKCPICLIVENLCTFADLKEHVASEHSVDRFCSLCYQTFENEYDFAEHILDHQLALDKRKCPICNGYFTYKINGKSPNNWHFINHMVKESSWKCSICSKLMFGYPVARDHASTHVDIEQVESRSSLVCREKGQPKKNGSEYNEPPVDKEIVISNEIVAADETVSQEIWPCFHCVAVVSSRPLLREHLIKEHITKEPALCMVCGALLQEDESMYDHLEQHLTMKCPVCNEENIGTFTELKLHVENAHTGNQTCPVCEENVESGRDFSEHIVNHQRAKDTRRCPVCRHYSTLPRKDSKSTSSYTTKISYIFGKHFVRHMVTKSCWKCGICSKLLSTHVSAKEHVTLTHMPPRSYRPAFQKALKRSQDVSNSSLQLSAKPKRRRIKCEKCKGKMQNCISCFFSTKNMTQRRRIRKLCKRLCEKEVRIVLKRVQLDCLLCGLKCQPLLVDGNRVKSLVCSKCKTKKAGDEIQQSLGKPNHKQSELARLLLEDNPSV